MSQSEFDIIAHYFDRAELNFAKSGVDLGIGDDCALLSIPTGMQLALSMDVLQADIHFPANANPALIAQRALAVNLSDLAAMSAQPLCFTLGMSFPEVNEQWLEKFSLGLARSAAKYNCPLVGGDLSAGPLAITIQVQGLVPNRSAPRRSGARVGDRIYVTGSLGDAALALMVLGIETPLSKLLSLHKNDFPAACQAAFLDAYYTPEPRLAFAAATRHLLNSAIDISDGLLGDLGHIVRASAVAAEIRTADLPVSSALTCCVKGEDRVLPALSGGDDYELCVSVSSHHCAELERIAADMKLAITCVGKIVAGSGVHCFDQDGNPYNPPLRAYSHFQNTIPPQGRS